MTYRLYSKVITNGGLSQNSSQQTRNVADVSVVTGGPSSVDSVSLQPGEKRLEGAYRGNRSDVLATEISELLASDVLKPIPFFDTAGTSSDDGYYLARTISSTPVQPQAAGAVHTFEGALKKTGTRRSHWRAASTTIASLSNDFGNSETPRVGIDTRAERPRWFDPEARTFEDASTVATRNAEFGDVDIYDPSSSTYSNPTLVYGLEYAHEGDVDCRVWDTRGLTDREDANNYRQWRKVYDTRSEFTGDVVIANGIVRLTLDESANTITAETWDDGAGAWSSVSLGTSDWELFDVDLTRIGTARIDAQLTFRDPTASPTTYYHLDARLSRGADAVLFTTPSRSTQGATPSGLVTLLDPIASESIETPAVEAGLVRRKEVRY